MRESLRRGCLVWDGERRELFIGASIDFCTHTHSGILQSFLLPFTAYLSLVSLLFYQAGRAWGTWWWSGPQKTLPIWSFRVQAYMHAMAFVSNKVVDRVLHCVLIPFPQNSCTGVLQGQQGHSPSPALALQTYTIFKSRPNTSTSEGEKLTRLVAGYGDGRIAMWALPPSADAVDDAAPVFLREIKPAARACLALGGFFGC